MKLKRIIISIICVVSVLFSYEDYNAREIGEFVNIGTGKDLTIKGLAEKIKNIVGFNSEIDWDIKKT